MGRIRDTAGTITLAVRYSLAFCWRHSRGGTAARVIITAATTLLTYLTVQATGSMVNSVQAALKHGTGMRSVAGPVAFLLSVFIITIILGRLNWFFRSAWNQTLRYANLKELNEHRATLDVARIKSKEYDDLEKRIQELPTAWQTRVWFSEEMLTLFSAVVSFTLFGASLIWYQPIYAIILLLTALPLMVTEFRQVSMWWNLFEELVPSHKKRAVLEKVYHQPTAFVQALMFGQMQPLRRAIDENVDSVIAAYRHVRWISVRNEMVVHLIAVAGLCGVIIHAVWSTLTAAGAIGTLTVVIAAARTFQANLEAIVALIAEQWNSAKGVVLIEQDFLGLKPVIKTEYPVVPRFDLTPAIRFENVSFTYPGSTTPALHDVSFVIEPGSRVAIVGKSGNGKSTIQALMMRHYDPTDGAIFADTINLRNIEPAVWSKVISALTQEYVVLQRRVSEEIASSRLDEPINMEKVRASSRFADFEEVAHGDPLGYDSQIGVEFGGRDFSGGEKQRLALARVHYRGTPVIILDEPDASLDPESAEKVVNQIFALEGVTVIMITHHVSRAERCDKVIVMGKGKVVEEGAPQELMARNGAYARLYAQDKKRLEGGSE